MHLVYLLRCADATLYTGYTTDLSRRLAQHQAGKGAKYTRARLPLQLLAAWEFPSKSHALSAEARFRKLRPAIKVAHAAAGDFPPELGCPRPFPLPPETSP